MTLDGQGSAGAAADPSQGYALFVESLRGSADYCPPYADEFTADHRRLHESIQPSLPGLAGFLDSQPAGVIQKLAGELLGKDVAPTVHNVLLAEIAAVFLEALAKQDPQAAMTLYDHLESWLADLPAHEEALQAVLTPMIPGDLKMAAKFFSLKSGNITRGWKGGVALGALMEACVSQGHTRTSPVLAQLSGHPDYLDAMDGYFPEEEAGTGS
ncbi:MAG: hypothetical protein JWO82_1781 [Akkermansiaceae bacterium]|nr:hypothetical protein [Akkermansiaceae bacterium]